MGPADQLDITGAKGGSSKPKTPVEAPDSLQSTNIGKILIAVGEGEFDGAPTDRDIFLDNTPIVDTSGNVNFPGVKWEWRPGSVEQDYIQGIPAIENETTVNVELRSDNPFARALSNTQLSAVRVRMVWPRLAQQDSSGNTNGYRIEYAIDIATDGGAYVEAHLGAVDGKTTNGYQRSVRVNLPKATSGWMLRVRRITPNANSGTVADTMTIAGYTEIIDEKLRYPNTALLYIEFDAQQFQNIPAVTVKCKAKRWPVPSNYDPIARTYTGVWDGTFKQAWTNNPAFATYGICVEDRFGLGKRIKSWMVDKWEMYRIAQYCDQLVPNGQGGQEPRYLCDLNLQGRAEAWTLLRDLSAIYRGMVYWAHGSLFMQADMPRAQDIDYVFTRANVIDGEFVYGGAERNTHYSRALVSYDNPANNYDTDVIPVTDNALQRRYRDRPVEISAIGCTRASEAQRRGKWALLSNSQDRTVTFKTGMEGRIPLPGYVIPVADELVAGRPNGGRISAAAGRVITLDRDTPIKAGDRLILNLPNGTAQARTVQSVAGRAVTVTTAYGVQPEPELQWAIDYDDLAVQLFRVLKTTRTQEGDYEITALEFNPSKFAAIDTGAKLDERPISVIPVTTVQPPASVTLSSAHMIDQGIAVSTMTIAWAAVEGAVAYDVEWRKDNGNWVSLQRVGTTSVDVVGIYAGAYLARVRAVSAFDIASIWKSSVLTQLNGKEGQPPAVTFLDTESLLFGIGIKWGFPAGAEDTQRTELWYSEGTDLGLATKLADLSYPQNEYVMQGLRAGQRFYFWARLVDRTGNIGPFFPVEGNLVTGAASADAGPILEQIAGEILESHLGQQLTEKIDLIDGNGPGSVNERVGTAKTELAQQISEVNNALASTKGNLEQQITAVGQSVSEAQAELQEQIDQIADLADSMPYKSDQAYTAGQGVLGEDGKLYQAKGNVPAGNPPPNATYWTDVGQAVQTANGLAARVSDVETEVSTLDGRTTAQATQIGGLQSSLTTTNQNVATAQQAADAANTLAGGKGKVIIQSAAPAVADRLAQNLWIDTTGNANTPKRWSGSAWVAVTDKAATDAATAAQSALSQVALKADATVVNNVATRVSEAEGKLSSQASRMDGMQTSIDGKASSQSLQQVSNRVTATEQKDAAQDQQLTSQSQALTSLTGRVDSKADASAVQSLGNEVAAHGDTLSAQGRSLTELVASIGDIGGENLFYNPSFNKFAGANGSPEGWEPEGSATSIDTIVPSWMNSGEKAQRIVALGLTNSSQYKSLRSVWTKRVKVSEGQAVTVSVYARKIDGDIGTRIIIQWVNAAGNTGIGAPQSSLMPLAAAGARLVFSAVAPVGAVEAFVYFRTHAMTATATNGTVEYARPQAEYGGRATGWRDNGQVNAASNAATSAAVDSLTSVVNQQAGTLSSVAGRTTSLENSLTTTNGNVATAQQAAQAAATAAGAKGEVIYGSSAPAADKRLAQNLWIDTTSNANTPKRWNGTTWVAVTDKAATDAAAAASSALSQVATKAEAATVQALSNAVDQHGAAITANGQAITNINTSLSQVGGENLLYNPSLDVVNASTAWLPDGWVLGNNGSTLSANFVASTLDPSGKALRLGVTLPNASSYVDLVQDTPKWPGVSEGQVLTISGHFRATNGLVAQLYFQWRDSTGAHISTDGATSQNASTAPEAWQRFSRTSAPAPAGAASVRIIYRIRGPVSGTSTTGWCEWDRLQLELGSTMTGWRDNGRVNEAGIAVNAAATTAVAGRVSATEAGLSSASSQLTQLDNSIGDIGGENLFYNPAFAKYASLSGVADGWSLEGSVTTVDTLVDSWLNSGEKAQRIVGSGFTASTGSGYKSLRPQGADPDRRPAVAPGQTVTASVHIRGTVGLSLRIFLQWFNAAGVAISAPASALLPITTTGDRKQFSGVAPAEAAKLHVYYRIYSSTGSVTSGNAELARPQLEYGARMTGWRDNGQVNAASNAATSAAVDSLTSVVNQQGGTLSSVAGRTTSLENSLTTTNGNVATAQQAAQAAATAAGAKGEVIYGSSAPAADKRLAQNLWIDTTSNANTPKRWNGTAWVAVTDKAATDAATAAQSALSQVATKAEAAAVQTLTNRVAAVEGVNTSQSASLVDLSNSVGAIQSSLGASGLDPAPGSLWQFETTTEGWAGGNATLAVSNGVLTVTPTTPDPQLVSSGSGLTLSIAGAQYTRVRAAITRRGGGASAWTGTLFYATASHGFAAEYRNVAANPNLAVGQSAVVEWDMANPTTGGDDWIKSVIGRLRFNFANDLASVFDVHWIAVGRVGPSASSRVVESLTSTVTQQGDKLTAEAQRIDGLYTSVGSAQAAIQNEITARTNADSALSQQIQTTQSTLEDTTASVQRVSTTLNQLNGVANASEVVKVQITANGIRHAAGFGLSIDNSKGAVQSTFAILANRFAILNPSGDAVSSPFAVVGNQTFISDAYIRDASIGNAKITNGAITTVKIGEAEVDTLRIRGNAVTIPVGAFAGSNTVSVTVTLDGNYPVFLQGSLTQTYQSDISMTRNGVLLWTERPQNSTLASRGVMDYPGPGTHTYTLSSNHAGNTNGASILAVVCKR
ncbi:phage tail protein [Pseudomonas asiatica]|uniref:phage tail protein n=1 Tax=Pseudomonas asiatica TaxID=2219225 RepID=UPI003C7E0CD3